MSKAQKGLPEGWVLAQISDVSVKGAQRIPKDSDSFTYVDIGSIDRNLKRIDSPQYLSGKDAPSRARKEIFLGDILVSLTRPNLNAVAQVTEKYHGQIASTGFEVIRPFIVESRYIFSLTRSKHFIDEISGVVQGALYPAAKSSDVQNYRFPLPPGPEQKVIVEKLDLLLAQVESIKTRLDRVPAILKRFRQAVLNVAVSGELTSKEKIKKHYSKWVEYTFENVASIIDPHPSHRTPEAVVNGVPYIGIGDIKSDDESIDFASARKVSYEILREHNDRYSLSEGDFIFGKIGTLGKATMLPINIEYTLSANVILIQPRKEKVVASFLRYLMSSPKIMSDIASQSNSTSQAAFGIKKMRAFKCMLPSLDEQAEIVARVEKLFAWADNIEKQVAEAQKRVNNLTQSILAKAFRGELTEQWRKDNPELISGENSAAALLERIKAERQATATKRKTKAKKQGA